VGLVSLAEIMQTIAENLNQVHARMQAACSRAPGSVKLLAVSKTMPADALRQAHAAGQMAFGENYIQEAVDKMRSLADLPLEWHCIGPIQSNKSKLVAENFAWVHSIDRLKIAQRLAQQRPANLPPLQVCLQVNVDGGNNKAGIAPSELLALARAVSVLPQLRLRGLMTLPEPAADFATACAVHRQARLLFESLQAEGFEVDTLSMGMTADLEAAVQEGSTLLRVGTAIFGAR
jgi:pyridoxal phosphate enzyme (YggS family)